MAVLSTANIGFCNVVKLPLGNHYGIVVVHFSPKMSITEIDRQLISGLSERDEKNFKCNFIMLKERAEIRRGRCEWMTLTEVETTHCSL